MRIESISMPTTCAYNTRKNGQAFNGGSTYVIVPADTQQGDSFGHWATKNIVTASVFSLAWDLGTNACAKLGMNVDTISAKEMFKNVPKVAGVFLLIGGIFKAVSHFMDKKN